MANISGDENFTSKLNQAHSEPPTGILAFFSAFNIILSITASMGNAVILIALHNVSSIYPPTKLFFRCLAVTDLCVGLFVQPVYATEIMSRTIKIDMNILLTKNLRIASAWILCGVSSITSTGISVDRLLALLLGLRYRHVVTLRRVRVVIICFWLIGVLCGALWVWREDISFKVTFIFLSLGLFTAIFCYTSIHIKLRYYKTRVQDNAPQGQANGRKIPLNIARYRKSVSSVLWVQLALVACYAPWGIVVVLYVNEIESDVAWLVSETLVYLNSSLNPILYCWTIRVVRRAVKDIIRQSTCS